MSSGASNAGDTGTGKCAGMTLEQLVPRVTGTLRLMEVPASLRGPLFVSPDEPLFIFDSADSLRRGIEWQDVADSPYPGFDVDGRSFLVEAFTFQRTRLFGLFRYIDGELRIRVLDSPPEPDRLRRLLIDALAHGDGSERDELDALTLAGLQAAAVEHYGVE